MSGKSAIVTTRNQSKDLAILGILNTERIAKLSRCLATFGSYEKGAIASLPIEVPESSEIADLSTVAFRAVCLANSYFEVDPHYMTALRSAQYSMKRTCETVRSDIQHCANIMFDSLSSTNSKYRDGFSSVPDWRRSFISDLKESFTIADLLSELVGCTFGRWDIRFATGEKNVPKLPDPFAPLPVCARGMLQNTQGLPLTKEDVQHLQAVGQWHYPVQIPWDGILVDDSDNPNDIVRRVREVLIAIWKEHADIIEQEASEILDIKDLREYFRKSSLFFAEHLKRYFKSRRHAPIYWPLSTASGSYTLWLYYHRLNDDSLYTALNKYVKPKIDDTEKHFRRLESELPNAMGREASSLRTEFEETAILLDELREFRDELARVADFPYKPNLNDGVLITASPLWKLFRLPKWRKEVQDCWKKLEAGDFDWANLAYSIWPDRVREICKSDRSIAIAHGLEALCQVATKPAKKKLSKKEKIEETVPGDEE
jgi:hypothetical protein